MDKYVTLIFEHRVDKDQHTEKYSIGELIYGIGKTNQPVIEIVNSYAEDGYVLILTTVQ